MHRIYTGCIHGCIHLPTRNLVCSQRVLALRERACLPCSQVVRMWRCALYSLPPPKRPGGCELAGLSNIRLMRQLRLTPCGTCRCSTCSSAVFLIAFRSCGRLSLQLPACAPGVLTFIFFEFVHHLNIWFVVPDHCFKYGSTEHWRFLLCALHPAAFGQVTCLVVRCGGNSTAG